MPDTIEEKASPPALSQENPAPSTATTDPVIMAATMLVDKLTAACQRKEEQNDEPEIPPDVPQFYTEAPWAS